MLTNPLNIATENREQWTVDTEQDIHYWIMEAQLSATWSSTRSTESRNKSQRSSVALDCSTCPAPPLMNRKQMAVVNASNVSALAVLIINQGHFDNSFYWFSVSLKKTQICHLMLLKGRRRDRYTLWLIKSQASLTSSLDYSLSSNVTRFTATQHSPFSTSSYPKWEVPSRFYFRYKNDFYPPSFSLNLKFFFTSFSIFFTLFYLLKVTYFSQFQSISF